MSDNTSATLLGPVFVSLLKGPITIIAQAKQWDALLRNRGAVNEFFSTIGLEVHLDEDDGYAFLRQKECRDGEDFPRLISRRPLSRPVSVLCSLLRRRFQELDNLQPGALAVLDREEIYELMKPYVSATENEKSYRAEIDRYLKRMEDIGIVAPLSGEARKIEIKRVIKAVVSAEWLNDLEQKLAQYRKLAQSESE